MAEANKVVIGVEKPHFAEVTEDTDTGTVYGTPEKIANAVSISITPNQSSSSLFADNVQVASNSKIGNIDLSINIDQLAPAQVNRLLGVEQNEEGVLEYKADDQSPDGAFGFRSPLSGGGYRYVWLYKGKFNLPEDSYETQTDGEISYQTKTLTGTFTARISDKKWRAEVDDTDLTDPAIAENWFDAVYEPGTTTAT